jgi:hypothetical protein
VKGTLLRSILSVPDVVDSETERTATGVLKCPSCGSKEQKLLDVDPINSINVKVLHETIDMGLAAWVLYLSSLSDLAAAAGVTEVTTRNRTQESRKKIASKIIR